MTGALFSYSLQAGLILAVCYLVFAAVLGDVKNGALQRYVLLGIVALSLVLPVWEPEFTIAKSAGVTDNIAIGRAEMTEIAADSDVAQVLRIILVGYYCGVLISAAVLFVSVTRLLLIIRSGRRQRVGGCTVVRVERDMHPMSWMGFVILGNGDSGEGIDMILAHERSHNRRWHSVDVLVVRAICCLLWYNPAAWLLLRNLALVHEYEADSDVLRCGFDCTEYQMMLIKKAAGPGYHSLANSLNHSKLKQRITMMCKSKKGVRGYARTLAMAPAVALALFVMNIPTVSATLKSVSDTGFAGKITENIAPAQEGVVREPAHETGATEQPVQPRETLASFPGGEAEMYAYLTRNMQYPQEAKDKGEQGRVVVSFKIHADGSISDIEVVRSVSPSLDAECVRIVRSMPAWEPATSNGQPVESSYTLPFTFKLPPE